MSVESIAAAFHETYERLAPRYGYVTRKESAVPWGQVPYDNRRLMCAVVDDLLARGVISGPVPPHEPGVIAPDPDATP